LSGDPVGGNNPTYTSAGLFSGVSLYSAITLYDIVDQVIISSRRNEFMYVVPAGFTALAQI
jgi:hypothetical protein